MNNFFHPFSFGPGKVVHFDFHYDKSSPIGAELKDLKEDLIQVEYGKSIIDIGWYPEFSAKGRYVMTVVRDGNWEVPVLIREAKTLDSLLAAVSEAVRFIGIL